jgi:cytochrome c biogenesis factor
MQDGQSLNALLQNYWMVIHPPILFLGFASTLIPFSLLWAMEEEYGSDQNSFALTCSVVAYWEPVS